MSKNRNVVFLREEYAEGQGTFTYNVGKYVGEWKKGKQHGQGTFTWFSGDRYEGEWRDGTENGQGTFIWSDGDSYGGEWKKGKPNGVGTYLGLMEMSMRENSRMGNNMVKEP